MGVLAFIFSLFLMFQPVSTTIAECLLSSGFSSAVTETPVTLLTGVDAWVAEGEQVLVEGENIGWSYFDDSAGARRMVSFHVWGGNVYAFVYKHPDDPGRRLPGDTAGTWHGDCFLRLVFD